MEDQRSMEVVSIPESLPLAAPSEAAGIDLVTLFRTARDQTVKILRTVPAIIETMTCLHKGKRYFIEWPDGMEKAFRSGAATWRPRGDGTFSAVIRDANGNHIVKHLRLRETNLPPELWQGLGQLATQNALAALAEKLEEMNLKLDELMRGARADRFGLIDSGWHQYEQAREAIDRDRRSRMLENALQSLLEGRAQLLRAVASEAEALEPPTAWQQLGEAVFFRAGPTERLGNRVADVTKDLEGAVLATRYVTLAHAELAEPLMARTAVRQLVEGLRPVVKKVVRLTRHCPRRIVGRAEERWTAIQDSLLPAAAQGDAMLSAVLDGKMVRLAFSPNEIGGDDGDERRRVQQVRTGPSGRRE